MPSGFIFLQLIKHDTASLAVAERVLASGGKREEEGKRGEEGGKINPSCCT